MALGYPCRRARGAEKSGAGAWRWGILPAHRDRRGHAAGSALETRPDVGKWGQASKPDIWAMIEVSGFGAPTPEADQVSDFEIW